MSGKNNSRKVWMLLSWVMVAALLLSGCGGTQAKKTYTIGVVNYFKPLEFIVEGFKTGMTELGYVEGENVTYIYNGVLADDPPHACVNAPSSRVGMRRESSRCLLRETHRAVQPGKTPWGGDIGRVGREVDPRAHRERRHGRREVSSVHGRQLVEPPQDGLVEREGRARRPDLRQAGPHALEQRRAARRRPAVVRALVDE